MTREPIPGIVQTVWDRLEAHMPKGTLQITLTEKGWAFGPIPCDDEGCERVLGEFARDGVKVSASSEDNGKTWVFTIVK